MWAKCQKDRNHDGKHETNFHFLQAFCVSNANVSNKLKQKAKMSVKICTARDTHTSKWISKDDIVSWDQFIRDQHPSWYPIAPSSIDRRAAKVMINMFFDCGLQTKLLNGCYKDCNYQRASKEDMKFVV